MKMLWKKNIFEGMYLFEAILSSVHVDCLFDVSAVHFKQKIEKTTVDPGDADVHVISTPRCFFDYHYHMYNMQYWCIHYMFYRWTERIQYPDHSGSYRSSLPTEFNWGWLFQPECSYHPSWHLSPSHLWKWCRHANCLRCWLAGRGVAFRYADM